MKEKFDAYVLWPLAKIVKGQFKRLKSLNSFFDQTSMLLYFKFPRGKKDPLIIAAPWDCSLVIILSTLGRNKILKISIILFYSKQLCDIVRMTLIQFTYNLELTLEQSKSQKLE